MRRPKTERVPRTRAGNEWTEAAFWGFLRSALRRASMRWPPIARLALLKVREPYTAPPGARKTRRKWQYRCAICGTAKWRDQVAVDHIIPCGKCSSFDELATFASRLFCEVDGLRILCGPCHAEVTREENR